MRVHRTLFMILLLLSMPLSAFGAAGAEVSDADIVVSVRDEGEGFSYRVPLPPGTRYDQNTQGLFRFAHEPFGFAFTGTQDFATSESMTPGTLYFFSYFASPKYTIIGDGRYASMAEALEDMGLTSDAVMALAPEEKAKALERFKELRDGMRSTTDPAEILAYLRRVAEWRWNLPSIMDFKKNGGDEYLSYLKDAAITTKRASLPAVDGTALATRLEFHIDSEELPMGRRFVDLSQNALYFVLGPRVVKIGTMDFAPRSEEDVFATLDRWRNAIIRANPDLKYH